MRIEIETEHYNTYEGRNWGAPWVAVLSFTEAGKKFESRLRYGRWLGDARKNSAGLFIIDAEPGDIILRAQKGLNTKPAKYYVVEPGGSLRKLANRAEAYKHWKSRQPFGVAAPSPLPALRAFTDDEIRAEFIRRKLKRRQSPATRSPSL